MIIPESQIKINEVNLNVHFPNYHVENHIMGGLGYARISILIKNNIEYQRLKAWEDDLISTVWLKVKVGHNKYINVMGGYRQWQLPLELGLGHMGEPEDQYTRLKTIFKQISKAKSTKINVFWVGIQTLICWKQMTIIGS